MIDTTYIGGHYNQTVSSKPLYIINTDTKATHPELAFSQH